MKLRMLLVGLLLAGAALACSATDNLTSSLPSRRPTATPTPSATPTNTPTATATPVPTPTPTPPPEARIHSGEGALAYGDWDTAIFEFENAHAGSGDPNVQSAALLGLGRAYLLAGEAEKAVELLEGLLTALPDAPEAPYAHFTLGQAYETLERYSEAASGYLNYLTLRPGVVDAYVLEMRGDALFAAGDYYGAVTDYQAALQSPSLRDGMFIEMKIARSVALAGDYEAALVLYNDIYNRSNNDFTRALIHLRKGQAYTALGQVENAYVEYQETVTRYPTSYDSYSALLALVEGGQPVDELNRGLVDYFAGQYGVAMAAFDRYLQNAPADPGTALYYYGLSERALGGGQDAVREWDRLISDYPDHGYWDEAWEQKAYTQWFYLDQYTLAIETLLAFVEAAPAHPRAGEFLFDAAQVAERFEKLDQAATLYARVSMEYPLDERALRAIFLQGVAQYRLGDYAAAQQTFTRALGAATALNDRAAASLWFGKSQQAAGDQVGALATWEQTASIDPTGYYSERARDLLMGREPFSPPQAYDLVFDEARERAKAETWMRNTFALAADADLNSLGVLADNPTFIRGAELWKLGLQEQARTEFEALRTSIASDPVLSYQLMNYLYELGLYRSAIFAARQVLDLAGMNEADMLAAPAYFNYIRFGPYYQDLIVPAAQELGFHPLLIFSLVRQESLFESFIRSSAAASGLMQIIPTTGEEIARNLGWPEAYSNRDLNRPLVNITFGTAYLDQQRRAFKGDLYAALAAYNGGPGRAQDWKRQAGDDQDLFLEVVHLSETRLYLQRIYENFNLYRRIYDRTP